MSQEQATVAEEEYLQIIYWLQEAGLPITGANIARAMQVSAPTVHEMIGRLEADGYVTRGADKSLAFTDSGQEHAAGIVRRHRLIERFLTDVFDIPWDQVHEEAERLEHWMSPMVEERMLRAIGDSKTCPHGHPIFEGEREDGRAARRRRGGRERPRPALRERGRGPAPLPQGHRPHPGPRGHARPRRRRRDRGRVERDVALGHPLGGRDGLGRGRPLAARRAPPCRTSSCSAASATAGSAPVSELADGLRRTAERVAEYRRTVGDRPVARPVEPAALEAALGGPLPDEGADPEAVIEQLVAAVEPGLVATAGPRYFGFVVGGSLDAATEADMLATGWDQMAFNPVSSPAAAAAEAVVARTGSGICSACRATRRSASRPERRARTPSRSRPRGTACWRTPAGTWRRTG